MRILIAIEDTLEGGVDINIAKQGDETCITPAERLANSAYDYLHQHTMEGGNNEQAG